MAFTISIMFPKIVSLSLNVLALLNYEIIQLFRIIIWSNSWVKSGRRYTRDDVHLVAGDLLEFNFPFHNFCNLVVQFASIADSFKA